MNLKCISSGTVLDYIILKHVLSPFSKRTWIPMVHRLWSPWYGRPVSYRIVNYRLEFKILVQFFEGVIVECIGPDMDHTIPYGPRISNLFQYWYGESAAYGPEIFNL